MNYSYEELRVALTMPWPAPLTPEREQKLRGHIAELPPEQQAELYPLLAEQRLAANGHQPGPGSDRGPSVVARVELLRSALVDTYGLDSIPAPVPLVDGVLYADSIAWLIGAPGHGKSFVALDIVGALAQGSWADNRTRLGSVLYLIAEGASGLRQRVRSWESSNDVTMSNVQFLPIPVQVALDGDWSALCILAAELRPSLIILDTQARVTVGMEENSARDMGVFVAAVEKLRKATGACVLVVHHQGRSGEHMRGSTALEGAATTIIRVTKDDEMVTVECTKQKDAPPFDPITLRLVPYDESAILALTDGTRPRGAGPSAAALRTVRAWAEHHGDAWVSASKLVDVIAAKSTIYRHIQELARAGVVQIDKPETGSGYTRYRLCSGVERP